MSDDEEDDDFEWSKCEYDEYDDDGDDDQPRGLRRGRSSSGTLERSEALPETDFKSLIGLGTAGDVDDEDYVKRERKERMERERKRANKQQKDTGVGGENDWSLKDVVVITVDKDPESTKGAFAWLSDRLDDSAARAMCGELGSGDDEGSSAVEFIRTLQFYTIDYTAEESKEVFEESLHMLARQLELKLVPFVYVISETFTVLLRPDSIHITPPASARRLLRELMSSESEATKKSSDAVGSRSKPVEQLNKTPYVALQGKEYAQRLLVLLLQPEFFKRVMLLSSKPFPHSTICIGDIRFGTSLKYDNSSLRQPKKACNCDTLTITSRLLPGSILHSKLLPLIRKQMPGIPPDSIVIRAKPSPTTIGFVSIKPPQELHDPPK